MSDVGGTAPDGKKWHTREESGIRIDRRGRWFHDDEPIEHPNIIEAFNRGLSVKDDGKYVLTFGNDWCFVKVEACAFQAVAVDEAEGDRLSIRLSDRTAELIDFSGLALDDEGVLTAPVKQGLARARFSREAQFQLAERFEVDGDRLAIRVNGKTYKSPLPSGGEG